MLTRDWFRRAALLLMVAAIAAAQHLTPPIQTHWHFVFPRLYYVPIVFAALYDGWRGGLIFTVFSSLAYFQNFLASDELFTVRMLDRYIELLSFCTLAALTGVYTDKERYRKKQYQEVAEKLARVYEALQVNIDGMKRAERLSAIGHLSAGLAHEVRNPLASIAGAAAILRRSITAGPKETRCIDIIEGESKRLNGLLTNFLNFARPRAPLFQSVSLSALLDDVIELAQHGASRHRIVFKKEITPEVSHVECDPEHLRQVLLNLLLNAVEASGPGAEVRLSASQAGENAVIQVIDEGSGVALEDIDKLFDPFFTTKETGTGLGLPVAHQIAVQMGGNLSARRNAGRGMTFSVSLPLRQKAIL